MQKKHKSRHLNATARHPGQPGMALYVLRADPAGGRPEAVTLLEALPSPDKVTGLDGIARRMEFHPYTPEETGQRDYGFLPVSYVDPRYWLTPPKD